LAPFLLLAAVAVSCGPPAQAPGAPAALHTGAAAVEEIAFEISALM
jgi:hypothetical protein